MKVLIDARSLGRKPSGIGMYIYNFVDELAKESDWDIRLLTDVVESSEMKKLQEDREIKIYSFGKPVSKNIMIKEYFRFIQKKIHEVKPDLFWEGNNLIPVRVQNPYGKIATTIYDMFPLSMPDCYGKIYPIYFRYGIYRTLKTADFLIYISEETRRETEKYFPKAKEKHNILSYIIVKTPAEKEISDEGYFLYIGNLEKRKGTDLLLKAYREYRLQGGQKKLVLAGKMREEIIRELYENINAEVGGIEYLGYVSEEEKNMLMAKCSCFLFPSRAEGFGMPIVEVMSYGKPIVAARLSIYRELFDDAIEYVTLGEASETVRQLCEKMQQYDRGEIQTKKYCEIITRYSAKNLSERVRQHIMHEMQEGI